MSRNTLQETTAPHGQQDQPIRQQPPGGCLLRIYWMFFGNALVALFALAIVQGKGGIGLADLLYWLGVASLVASRYVDIHYLGGGTAEGEPATRGHWRRYSLRVLGVAALLWLAVHGVGFLGG